MEIISLQKRDQFALPAIMSLVLCNIKSRYQYQRDLTGYDKSLFKIYNHPLLVKNSAKILATLQRILLSRK